MTSTMTIEGDNTSAVDTRSSMTTQGSVTAPSFRPPSGKTKIDQIICAVGCDGLVDGGVIVIFRLTGGVKDGPHSFCIAGTGGELTAGADNTARGVHFRLDDVNLDLTGDNLVFEQDQGGVDQGTISLAVTLVFK